MSLINSDTSYACISSHLKLIDIIDDDWVLDQLEDDDIDLPKDMAFDEEDDDQDSETGRISPDDIWEDNGLDEFSKDINNNTSTSTTHISIETPQSPTRANQGNNES